MEVALRWVFEQGVSVIVKSYNADRMRQNLDIFDWSLTADELHRISEIPQSKGCVGTEYTSDTGPYKTLQELWDEEVH